MYWLSFWTSSILPLAFPFTSSQFLESIFFFREISLRRPLTVIRANTVAKPLFCCFGIRIVNCIPKVLLLLISIYFYSFKINHATQPTFAHKMGAKSHQNVDR